MLKNISIIVLISLTVVGVSYANDEYANTYTDLHTVYVEFSKEKGSKILYRCVFKFSVEVISADFVYGESFTSGSVALDKLYVTFKGPDGAPYIGIFDIQRNTCKVFFGAEEIDPPMDLSQIPKFDFKSRSQFTNYHVFLNKKSQQPSASEMNGLADVALFGPGFAGGTLANDYYRYSVKDNGESAGQKKALFNNPTGTVILGGSISRDGKMAVQFTAKSATSWQITTKRITNGNPASQGSSWSVPAYGGYSLDISGPVTLNFNGVTQTVRYLVYRAFRNVGTVNQESQLLSQAIDDATGNPIGGPKQLTSFVKAANGAYEAAQGIAVAPDASHVIFNSFSNSCQRYIVKRFQLSSMGERVGGIKTIVPCEKLSESGARGFNIAQNP